jgi:hypothetical protein
MDGKVPQAKFVDNPELRKSIQEKVIIINFSQAF